MSVIPKNNYDSIDRNQENLNNLLLLAENIPKYPCCFKEVYPSTCAPEKCGKWRSISKVMKLKPQSCKRRWKTLKKHFGLGLLTNRQLIDKLQFLKDVANEIPSIELRNNLTQTHNASSRYIPSSPTKSYNLRQRTAGSAGICIERMQMSVQSVEVVDLTSTNEKNVSQEKETQAKDNILNTGMIEECDSDVEIIEPNIETIVVED